MSETDDASAQPDAPLSPLLRIAGWAEHPAFLFSAVAVLAGLACLVLLLPVRNGDFAWHLALGHWIHATGTIPSTEPFTYTAFGQPMVAHEWLSQWLYWVVAQGPGLFALRILHAVVAALFVGGVFIGMRRASVSPALALAGCIAFVVIAIDRFQVRPHLVNFCFGLALYIFAFIERPKLSPAQIGAFAAAMVVWVNAHSGAVLFPALLFGYACVDAVDRRILRRGAFDSTALGEGIPARVWQLTAACSMALLITPNHVRLLPYLVRSGPVNAGHSLEWLSILQVGQQPGLELALAGWALALIGVLWATGVVVREGRSLALAAVAVACAIAPLQSVRFTWLAFAPLIFTLAEVSRLAAAQPLARRAGLTAATSLSACIAIPWLFLPAEGIAARFEAARQSSTFAAAAFPLRSSQILQELTDEAPLEGRVFARSEWGGYITLTLEGRYPIFSDGRWVTIGDQIVRAGHRIATGREGALELADDFDLSVLIVERDWLETKPDERDRQWVVAFAGYNSQILVRRDESGAANRERFARYYRELGIPFDTQRGFEPFPAWNANHAWARSHGVRRKHIRHFFADGSGRRSEVGREVVDWEQRQPTPR